MEVQTNNKIKYDKIKLPLYKLEVNLKEAISYLESVSKGLPDNAELEFDVDENYAIDTFWGRTPSGEGSNELGKIWMELRNNLLKGKI